MDRIVQALDPWEICWAPYDGKTYRAALSHVQPNDVILDIGAGDLRLARQMATIAQQVFALELQPQLLQNKPIPDNLTVICGDARYLPWPDGITLGILLMRHCTCVDWYVARLREAGCRRLVTNARWGMDVELMDLGPRAAWDTVEMGWYACTCGQTGFVSGPPEQLTTAGMEQVHQVETCPGCNPN